MSTASRLAKLAEGLDSNGVLSADKGGTGATSLAAVVTSATPAGVSDQTNTSTGYFDLPSGTTGQRPGSAHTGMVRYNSTLSIVETYNGTSWTGLGGGAATVSASAPASPTDGAFWLNSETGDLNIYAGGAWILAGGGGGSSTPADGSITTAMLADSAVTPAKIATATSYLPIASGTTAQRPSSPAIGSMRLNTTTDYLEIYNSGNWVQLQYAGAMMTATYSGATATADGNYRVLTFTSSGTFTPSIVPIGTTIDYLIVAGGGGGGTDMDVGGGGGAGGLLTGTITPTAQTYTITVGAGGAQGTGPDVTNAGAGSNGTQGGNSSAFGLTTIGGGYGGTRNQNGGSGGSGGGGGDFGGAGGTGTTGQGYAGGAAPGGNSNNGWDVGAGGGAGGAANSWLPGPGLANSITGTVVTYAAGARGANATAGIANTGNGGSNRAGGSGVVIIRYRFQ